MRKFFPILTVYLISIAASIAITVSCVSTRPEKTLTASQLDEVPTGEEKVGIVKAITEHLDQLRIVKEKTALEFRFTPTQAATIKGTWLRELIVSESLKRGFIVVTGTKTVAGEAYVVLQVVNPENTPI